MSLIQTLEKTESLIMTFFTSNPLPVSFSQLVNKIREKSENLTIREIKIAMWSLIESGDLIFTEGREIQKKPK